MEGIERDLGHFIEQYKLSGGRRVADRHDVEPQHFAVVGGIERGAVVVAGAAVENRLQARCRRGVQVFQPHQAVVAVEIAEVVGIMAVHEVQNAVAIHVVGGYAVKTPEVWFVVNRSGSGELAVAQALDEQKAVPVIVAHHHVGDAVEVGIEYAKTRHSIHRLMRHGRQCFFPAEARCAQILIPGHFGQSPIPGAINVV